LIIYVSENNSLNTSDIYSRVSATKHTMVSGKNGTGNIGTNGKVCFGVRVGGLE